MKNIVMTLLVMMAFLLQSCRSHKELTPAVIEQVKVETRYERIVETDTVFVEVPAQMAERETRDSVSFLETDFATSVARINLDGSLFHNLINKNRDIAVPVDKITEKRDSVVYVDKEVKVPVPVEKKLTKWESWKIEYAGFLLTLVLLEFVIIVRKPLFSAIRKLFPKA